MRVVRSLLLCHFLCFALTASPFGAMAETLRAIVLTTPTDARATPSAPIDVGAIPALDTDAAREALRPFLGEAVDQALVHAVRDTVQAQMDAHGRPYAAVSVPAQDIAGGIMRVRVEELRIGAIRVEGHTWFGADQYTDAMRMRVGEPFDAATLAGDLGWINRNPFRRATAFLATGARPGDTDLVLDVKDRLPVEYRLGFDNTGTSSTGLYRLGAGISWGNAFWRGDQLTYNFVVGPDLLRLRQHVVGYTADLPWRDTIGVTASLADTRGESVDDIATNGRTVGVSIRYSMPLIGTPRMAHRLDVGFDYKSTNSNVLSGGVLVFPTTTDIGQFVLDYAGQVIDGLGSTAFVVAIIGSPGHLLARNNTTAFATQQIGAAANYVYGRLTVERQTPLPAGFAWNTRLTAQYGDAILLPSEQLSFGGVQSVRGFVEQGVTRDHGVLLQNEWRAPPIPTGLTRALNLDADTDTLTPFVFMDIGYGANHREIAGLRRSWVGLIGVGPGVVLQVTRQAALRLTWGIPLTRVGQVGSLLGPQFGLQLAF